MRPLGTVGTLRPRIVRLALKRLNPNPSFTGSQILRRDRIESQLTKEGKGPEGANKPHIALRWNQDMRHTIAQFGGISWARIGSNGHAMGTFEAEKTLLANVREVRNRPNR